MSCFNIAGNKNEAHTKVTVIYIRCIRYSITISSIDDIDDIKLHIYRIFTVLRHI